jgi:hypothetical protein
MKKKAIGKHGECRIGLRGGAQPRFSLALHGRAQQAGAPTGKNSTIAENLNGVISDSFEGAFDVARGVTQNDRTAVWAAHWIFGF